MSSTFEGGTSYTNSIETLAYLKISNYTSSDTSLLDNTICPIVSQQIDTIAGTTWGSKQVNETYSIGKYTLYGLYTVGAPVQFRFSPIIPVSTVAPIQTMVSFKVWNGASWEEWVNTKTEGRNNDYWFDPEDGLCWINGWFWWMGLEVQATYNYGYNTSGTNKLDGQVHELAILKSARMFLDSERYTALVTEGIGGVSMVEQWKYLDAKIQLLESAIAGFKISGRGIIS